MPYDPILTVYRAHLDRIRPGLPGGQPIEVDREGLARRVARELGVTVDAVREIVEKTND